MREEQQVPRDERTEGGASTEASRLVVLNPTLGVVAHATLWMRATLEGQRIIAVPKLRLEHTPAMMLAGGSPFLRVFGGCSLKTDTWEEPAGFVGGMFMLWRTSEPNLEKAGFVLGQDGYNIERAVRGVSSLLT